MVVATERALVDMPVVTVAFVAAPQVGGGLFAVDVNGLGGTHPPRSGEEFLVTEREWVDTQLSEYLEIRSWV